MTAEDVDAAHLVPIPPVRQPTVYEVERNGRPVSGRPRLLGAGDRVGHEERAGFGTVRIRARRHRRAARAKVRAPEAIQAIAFSAESEPRHGVIGSDSTIVERPHR